MSFMTQPGQGLKSIIPEVVLIYTERLNYCGFLLTVRPKIPKGNKHE
jgi:hypothetical protein